MALVLLLCLSILVSPLAATTVQRFDLADLVTRADRIVVGICNSAEPRLIDGQIYTRYIFSVDQALKGEAARRLELHLPGGHLQGVFSRIAGMPVFAPGDEAVLFLTPTNQLGHAWPVGLAQGRFSIVRDGQNHPRVFQALDGLSLHPTGAAKQAPAVDPVQGLSLDTFLERVRSLSRPAAEAPDAH